MDKLILFLAGMMLSVMLVFNGALSAELGLITATFVVNIIGFIGALVAGFLLKTDFKNIFKQQPIYLYLGGAFSVVVILINTVAFTKVGISLTIALSLVGQLIFSSIIDHFGLFDSKVIKFNVKKILGFSFMTLGILVMIYQ
ncbi:MAG: DMT family transporter [Acidaminobacteraceae bacterium]